nr:MAG TPA: hypothetical protein [Caudoviricetes sp.]
MERSFQAQYPGVQFVPHSFQCNLSQQLLRLLDQTEQLL